MKKVEGIILKIVGWIMALLIFVMMADIFAAVLSRYVFRSSLSFAEELGRYIFVWITFLGMARCIASDKHVALDLISHALSGEVMADRYLCNQYGVLYGIDLWRIYDGQGWYETEKPDHENSNELPLHRYSDLRHSQPVLPDQ